MVRWQTNTILNVSSCWHLYISVFISFKFAISQITKPVPTAHIILEHEIQLLRPAFNFNTKQQWERFSQSVQSCNFCTFNELRWMTFCWDSRLHLHPWIVHNAIHLNNLPERAQDFWCHDLFYCVIFCHTTWRGAHVMGPNMAVFTEIIWIQVTSHMQKNSKLINF